MGGASYDDFVRNQFEQFRTRKKGNVCRLEQFIAVGHSSGASAIINEIKAGNLNKDYPPAFLGTVDPVLSKDGKDITFMNGGLTYEVNYYQKDDLLFRGTEVPGADENHRVRKTSHMGIIEKEEVIEGIAEKAAQAYEFRVRYQVRWTAAVMPWDTSIGGNHW